MKRVAITGISGHLGSKLQQRLEQEPEVESIIGIDLLQPRHATPKLKFYRQDIREPFGDIFVENDVDSAIHLAFVLVPGHNTEKSRQVNLGGTKNFLRACHKGPVKWLLFLSSNTAYGGHADNPVPITEDRELRPDPNWTYAWHKAECEQMFKEFKEDHPDKQVAIIRSCAVLGPNGVGTGIKEMFTPVAMVRCIGHDALWQFIHEDDWVELTLALLRQKPEGVFNVAGEGHIRYTEIASALGRRVLPLPGSLLKAGLVLSWDLRLQSKSPVGGLNFLKYPLVMSTEKIQKTTGYKCRYTSHQALDIYNSKTAPASG